MCCAGKCLFFIPLRTGSMIFGYVIAVISALGTLACTGATLYFIVELMFPSPYADNWGLYTCTSLIIITGLMAEFLSSFICSVLLLVGIYKKKSSLLKVFIVYGMIQVVLLVLFFITVHCKSNFFNTGLLFLALAFLGIYSLCIYMVFLAHQLMNRSLGLADPVNPTLF